MTEENELQAEAPKFLSKAEILGAQDMTAEVVQVPEWGGAVQVKTMTGGERDAFEVGTLKFDTQGNMKGMNRSNMRARLCAFTMVDGTGSLLFETAEVEALGAKSAAALSRVFEVAQRLNGMGLEQEVIAESFTDAQVEGSSSD